MFYLSELYSHILTHGLEKDISTTGDMEKLFRISLPDKVSTAKHTGDNPFSCKHCNQSFENQVEMENHQIIHTEKNKITEDLQPRYSQKQTIAVNLEDPNGPLPHTGEKSICNQNNQSFESQTNMIKHMLKQTGTGVIPAEKLRLENSHSQLKTGNQEDFSYILPNRTGEQTIACPICDYRCVTSVSMKVHMTAHKAREVYVCEVKNCNFHCESKEEIQAHNTLHNRVAKENDSYANATKSTTNQSQNQNEWILVNNGKGKTTNRSSSVNSSNHGQQSAVPRNSTQFNNDNNHRNQHLYQNSSSKHYQYSRRNARGQTTTVTGTNTNSALSVAPQPHWAKIFATRYSPHISPSVVKNDLEQNLQKITGKVYEVQVEPMETKYSSYCSFKISCFCVNSEVFMDSRLWPENVMAKWFRQKRFTLNAPDAGALS